jgi:hypothetical protein
MDWLDPPYQFFHPTPEVPFELQVVRYEVGMAQRPINDPPGYVQRATIRFHLATPIPPSIFDVMRRMGSAETVPITPEALRERPYLDFTNQVLARKVFSIYHERIQRVLSEVPFPSTAEMAKLADSRPEPLVLRLTRHGLRIDTIYDVEVVET